VLDFKGLLQCAGAEGMGGRSFRVFQHGSGTPPGI
jgi:hypothetical protein